MSAPAPMRRFLAFGLVGGALGCLTGCGAPPSPPEVEIAILTPSGRAFVGDPPHYHQALLLVARRGERGDVRVLGHAAFGSLTADLPRRDEQVEVWAAGCLPTPVPWPPREPVRLREGIRARVRVTAPGGLPAAPFHVGLKSTWYGPGDLQEAPLLADTVSGAPVDWLEAPRRYALVDPILRVDAENPEIDATFSRPGPHQLRITVWEVKGQGVMYGRGPSDPGVVIEVQPEREGPPQEIDVVLDAGFLREATERGAR